ncbi:MAG: hypothetical protein NXH88_09900 [Hyphomonas sp.]|nr:hypothetical protein [Hyphomonas sp.]
MKNYVKIEGGYISLKYSFLFATTITVGVGLGLGLLFSSPYAAVVGATVSMSVLLAAFDSLERVIDDVLSNEQEQDVPRESNSTNSPSP